MSRRIRFFTEAAVRLYGADGTEFGCEWISKLLAESRFGDASAREDLAPQCHSDDVAIPKVRAARNSRRVIFKPGAVKELVKSGKSAAADCLPILPELNSSNLKID